MGQEFGKNGSATRALESIPIIGYGVAAAQGLAKNFDEAKRAAAKCTNSNLAVIGGVAGGAVGGPAGAVAGAVLMKGAGIATEYGIGHNHIDNAEVRAQTVPTLESATLDLALAGAGAGAGAVGSTVVKEMTKTTVKQAGGYLSKEGLKQCALEFAGSQVVCLPLVTVPGAFATKVANHSQGQVEKSRPK